MKAVLTMVFTFLATAILQAGTMPTRTEIESAMPAVRKAMADDWAALERGGKTLAAIAEDSLSHGHKAKSSAERFMLLKGAVFLFVQAGLFDRAAETLAAMRSEFEGMPEKTADEIAKQATSDNAIAKKILNESLTISDGWKIPANLKTPLVRKLYLNKDTTMDFAAIPPGTFQMSNAGGKGSHKVTISHPFWISRTYVTTRQYAATTYREGLQNETMAEYERLFPDMDVAAFRFMANDYERACRKLNEKFASRLPEGYEFRLPTEAEFEYALRQGNGKAKPLLVESLSKRLCKNKGVDFKGGVRLLPRGGANGWGVMDGFVDAVHVMDKVDIAKEYMSKMRNSYLVNSDAVNKIASYADGEVDPVRRGKYRLIRHSTNMRILAKYHHGLARIVIGPKLR